MRSKKAMRFRATALLVALLAAAIALAACPGALAATGWQAQQSGKTVALYSVSAVDANTAWAVGNNSTILKTTDGGTTWLPQATPSSLDFVRVKAIDAKTAWAAANPGTILKTTDGGTTWLVKFQNQSGNINGLTAFDANTAWAVGFYTWNPSIGITDWNSVVIRTTDGGASWAASYTANRVYFYEVAAPTANVAWVVGPSNASNPTGTNIILKTGDGGNSWASQATPGNPGQIGVSAASENVAWTCGANGTVFRTVDGGVTWSKKLDLGLGAYATGLICISALDANVAWAVGAGGYILKTSDGGVTWMVQRPTGSSELYSVSTVDASTAWAVGEGGTILRTTDGGGGSVILNINTVAPASAANLFVVDAQIAGSGFAAGATVRLERSSTVINATDVVVSPSQITCKLNLNGQPLGKYNLIVKNPNGQEAKLAGGFSITDACGQGAGASIVVLAGMMSLLSMAGLGFRRHKRR